MTDIIVILRYETGLGWVVKSWVKIINPGLVLNLNSGRKLKLEKEIQFNPFCLQFDDWLIIQKEKRKNAFGQKEETQIKI